MYDVLRHQFGNPSAQYPLGREAKELVEESRAAPWPRALGASHRQLLFTSCGTESDNWAIRAAVWQGRHVGQAHHHHRRGAQRRAGACRKALEQEGYEVTYLKPDRTGRITAEQVADGPAGGHGTGVHDAGEQRDRGASSPWRRSPRLLKERGSRALLHCDAVQGFLKVPCDRCVRWGVDLISPLRPQDRRPQGHRRSVRRSRSCGTCGPSSPAAGRSRACAPARRPPPRSRALPRPWCCGGRGWRKSIAHMAARAGPTAVERTADIPGWCRIGQRRRPPHSVRVAAGLSQCRTSSPIWASRASASPPAPPATRARPAGASCRSGAAIKGPPPGCMRRQLRAGNHRRATSTPCTRRCSRHKNTQIFHAVRDIHAAMSEAP